MGSSQAHLFSEGWEAWLSAGRGMEEALGALREGGTGSRESQERKARKNELQLTRDLNSITSRNYVIFAYSALQCKW